MTKVLIITKNLLAEQDLQAVLQRSNAEVYCSYDLMLDAQHFPQVISYFSAVIFSDTISTLEVSKYYSTFKQNGLFILRKGNPEHLKQTELSYLFDEIDDWIDPVTSNLGIIEKIAKLTSKQSIYPSSEKRTNSKIDINSETFFFSLSSNEKKLLYHLYQFQKDGAILSREKLCSLLWETQVTKSNLCQLSNLTNRIRKKLSTYNFPEGELITSWNKGYFLGDLLYNEVKNYLD
ncbi:transcriptional regulator [Enterococcus avium]|uniref:helix-turn-helix domain-containing protein n=1 Tax=Enterococcus malodoratus TaxID=71451 RepID=UPI0008CEDFEB|nr:helix-turn-helix domain-containing protein [Enterococcus malodoratus]BBM16505.1 transcriptional regulator [Enterococcus avium]SET30383.1 Transcriptional regulatory protein, C terminal [Enterococcus malodoratus]